MTFHQLLVILRARFRMIAFAAMTGVALATLVTMTLPDQFKADASLMVAIRPSAGSPERGVPASLYDGFVATQMDLVTSQAVAVEAVRELDILNRPERQAEFERALRGPASPVGALKSVVGRFGSQEEDEKTTLAANVEERIWADRLRAKIKPSNGANSSIIDISFVSADPTVSEEVVNAFAKAYLRTVVALNVGPAQENARWFDDQVQTLASELEEAQAELSEYQRKEGIVATDERLDTEQAKLMELSSELTQVQAESIEIQSRKDQAARFAASGGDAGLSPDVLDNPMVLHLKQQISEQQAKLNELSGRVGRNHPTYKQTVAELGSLRQRLRDEIQTISSSVGATAKSIAQREQELTRAVRAQKRKLLDMRATRDRVEVLRARVQNAQQVYDNALKRVSEARMESHSTQSNVSLVNPAVAPVTAAGPKHGRHIVLGLAGGLLIGIGLALWREVQERTVRSGADVGAGLGLPVLAVVKPNTRRRAKPGVASILQPRRLKSAG